MNKTLVPAALVLALGAFGTKTAEAGVHVHIGGHVHVHVGGAHGTVHWTVSRPQPPALHVHVGGAIWVGGGTYYGPRFAEPPPPPPENYCACDDGGYYGPVRPAPAVYDTPVAAPRQPLPRFGLGVAAGGVDVDGKHAGSDLALLGRYRLTAGLGIEGEIGKNELADGTRVDRRLGASLVYELGAYNRWAPYAVGGLGVSQVDVGGGSYQSDQSFAEIGVGLRYRLSRHIDIAADVRAGSRKTIDQTTSNDQVTPAARAVTPDASSAENYTRMRISGLIYF